MPKEARLNSKVDEQLYSDFKNVLKKLGISTTTAFRIYMKKVVKEQGIPFELNFYNNNLDTKKTNSIE